MSLQLQRKSKEYLCTMDGLEIVHGQLEIPAAWILKQEKNGLRDRLKNHACDPDILRRFR